MSLSNSQTIPQKTLAASDISAILNSSLEEGYPFIERLVHEYQNGSNQFNKPGEILLAVIQNSQWIAIGGLNQDPYLPGKQAGRVRHVYVLPNYRRQGIGKMLLQALITHAKENFQLLTLRTFTPEAALFYQNLGFQTDPEIPNVSHHMDLSD